MALIDPISVRRVGGDRTCDARAFGGVQHQSWRCGYDRAAWGPHDRCLREPWEPAGHTDTRIIVSTHEFKFRFAFEFWNTLTETVFVAASTNTSDSQVIDETKPVVYIPSRTGTLFTYSCMARLLVTFPAHWA